MVWLEGYAESRSDGYAEQALRIARLTGEAVIEMLVRSAQAFMTSFRGDYRESLDRGLRAIELAESGRDFQSEWYARYFNGTAYLSLGEHENGIQQIEAMIELSDRSGYTYTFAAQLLERSSLLIGDWEALLRPVPDSAGRTMHRSANEDFINAIAAVQTGETTGHDVIQIVLQAKGRLIVDGGGLGIMQAAFISSVRSHPASGDLIELIVRLSADGPDTSRQDQKFRRELDLAVSTACLAHSSMPEDLLVTAYQTLIPLARCAYYYLSVDRMLGRLAMTQARIENSGAHFEDAITFCRKAGYRPELAWSLCDYADMLLDPSTSSGRTEEERERATAMLGESLAISTELGMRPLMERVLSRREILKA